MNTPKARNTDMDALSGFLILYMMLGHIVWWTHFDDEWFYTLTLKVLFFFMPWFFFKSGMYHKQQDLKQVSLRSARRLLLPWLVFSLLGTAATWFEYAVEHTLTWYTAFLLPLKDVLLYGCVLGNSPLWFLFSLFFVRIIYTALRPYVHPLLLMCMGFFIGWIFHAQAFTHFHYLMNVPLGMSFYALGNFLNQRGEAEKPSWGIALTAAGVYVGVLWLLPSYADIHTNRLVWGNYGLWLLSAIAALLCWNRLFCFVFPGKQLLATIGKDSMYCYVLHWIPLVLGYSVLHVLAGWNSWQLFVGLFLCVLSVLILLRGVKSVRHWVTLLLLPVMLIALSGCEKAQTSSDSGADGDTGAVVEGTGELVTLRAVLPSNVGYTDDEQETPPQNLSDFMERITFAVFNGSNRVAVKNQLKGDDSFGTYSLRLEKGTYRVVVILHDGAGNVTLTKADEIKFPNNKVTDTFYYCDNIEVTAPLSQTLVLQRAVAKILFAVNDALPAELQQMKFYYTGGSSTFDATTGKGCVNSRQTEYRDVTPAMWGGYYMFPLYTFPRADSDELHLQVTSINTSGEETKNETYEGVPVVQNYLTIMEESFFSDSDIYEPVDSEFTLIDQQDDWSFLSHAY